MSELWGDETRKAIDNFPVSGRPIPVAVVRWLGRIKAAAARVNAELGLLDRGARRADRERPPTQVAAGEHDDQFPIDVFQTGSGTSSNMNANEVIASLAGDGAHPNDHVNMGQSSNDVFPSAVHLAALDRDRRTELLPALDQLHASLAAKSEEFARPSSRPVARTFRMPCRCGWARSSAATPPGSCSYDHERIATAADRLRRLGGIPSGGTATGTGLNAHPQYHQRMVQKLSELRPASRYRTSEQL